jgi:hypothetical protein
MLLRPTHSRVIMPAPITGRDSTAQYNAVRGPTAAWRAVARADLTGSDGDLSFRSRLFPPDDQHGNEESSRDGSAHGQAEHVASGDEIPFSELSIERHRHGLVGDLLP